MTITVLACSINLLKELREDQMKADAELANPNMGTTERIARLIARGLGHNDDGGMEWRKYVSAARTIIMHCRIDFIDDRAPR